jgi:hypothetical protein
MGSQDGSGQVIDPCGEDCQEALHASWQSVPSGRQFFTPCETQADQPQTQQ